MNNSPSKNTSTADKSGLNKRKTFFKNSLFIQQFPVIVLACSDYIKNNDKIREIDEVFNVKYYSSKIYNINTMNGFYIHYNKDKTKLVIHTRQLSQNVKNDLLQDLGLVIREHLEKLSS